MRWVRSGKLRHSAGLPDFIRLYYSIFLPVFLVLVFVASAPNVSAKGKEVNTSGVASHIELDPLRPPDLSSPRETLLGFISNTSQGIKGMRQEASPQTISRAMRRAALTLDLSEIPSATRVSVGVEKVLLLKEILDRIEVPPLEEIPGAISVREENQKQWVIPKTELTIVQIEEGPRAGAFVFSSHTVALLEQYYALVKPLPYKSGASVGAYEDFLYSPGPLLPRSWVDVFPRWSLIVVAGQTLWQWIGILLVLVVVVTCTSAVYAIGRRWDQNFAGVSALLQFGKPATSLFLILAMPIVSIVADSAINFTGLPRVGLEFIIVATTYGSAAWLAALIILRIGEGVINSRRLGSVSLNSQLIRTISLLVAAVVVIYIAVVAAEAFGVPIAPLIAGLGIGGLAIALAVRPTLENIIGGFILFADKPVKVGDFCSFGDKRGTVEKIGIRSTQLRAIDRTLISIPNAQFANMELVNWAECDEMLINEVISLRYETTADQLRYFLAKLREMLHAHPRINSETVRVRFSGYGESSLNVTVRVYALTREWNDYHAIREDIFLRVYDLVNEAGTGFAFPSSTVYLSKDEGLDSEIALSAVDEVNAWRRDGQLPFPNFSSGQLEKIGRSLDYPPQGSTDSSSPKGVENEAAEPLSANTESDLYPENNRPKN